MSEQRPTNREQITHEDVLRAKSLLAGYVGSWDKGLEGITRKNGHDEIVAIVDPTLGGFFKHDNSPYIGWSVKWRFGSASYRVATGAVRVGQRDREHYIERAKREADDVVAERLAGK